MMRITVDDDPRVLTFRLEGRLEGAWVQELKACLQNSLARPSGPTVRVDLTDVTFVDSAGKRTLSNMHRRGAELVAADCLTKAVVDEVTAPRAGRRKR
jgi:anti-anti-sigma factor